MQIIPLIILLHKASILGIHNNRNSHFSRNLFPLIFPKKYIFDITSFCHKTSYCKRRKNCDRNKFLSQKKVYVTETETEKIFPSGYQFSLQKKVSVRVSVRKTYFGHRRRKKFLSHKKFLSQKTVSVMEFVLSHTKVSFIDKSFRHRSKAI